MITRRLFGFGAVSLLAAPAIVRAGSLMRVVAAEPKWIQKSWADVDFATWSHDKQYMWCADRGQILVSAPEPLRDLHARFRPVSLRAARESLSENSIRALLDSAPVGVTAPAVVRAERLMQVVAPVVNAPMTATEVLDREAAWLDSLPEGPDMAGLHDILDRCRAAIQRALWIPPGLLERPEPSTARLMLAQQREREAPLELSARGVRELPPPMAGHLP